MTARTITVEALAAALDAEVPAFLDVTLGSTVRDELAAAIFAALPAEPAGEYSGYSEREGKRLGISRHNPFVDRINVIADTPAEPAGAGLREALLNIVRWYEANWSDDLVADPPEIDEARAALAATPVGEEEG